MLAPAGTAAQPGAAAEEAGLLAIGGALSADNRQIYERMLPRGPHGRVVIVPYASADQPKAAATTIERCKVYRPELRYDVLPDPVRSAGDRTAAVQGLAGADLIYFTGGQQRRR